MKNLIAAHWLGALLLCCATGILACNGACNGGHNPAPDVGAPQTQQRPHIPKPPEPPKTPPPCPQGEIRCATAQQIEVCGPDGFAPQEGEPCADACLGGACVELAPLAPSALSSIGPQGWLNSWSALGRLPAVSIDEQVSNRQALLASGTSQSWRSVCAGDGFLEVMKRLKANPSNSNLKGMLLAGHLVAGRTQDVLLKLGVMGDLTLWAGADAKPIHITRNAWVAPMADEQTIAMTLKPGLNPIVIALKRTSKWPVGLKIRVRDAATGQTPIGVRFAQVPGVEAVCPLVEQVSVDVNQHLEEGNVVFDLDAHVAGLAPAGVETIEVEAAVALERGPSGEVCGSTALKFDRRHPEKGWRGRFVCKTPADNEGPRQLRVTARVNNAPVVLKLHDFQVRPKAQERVLKVREALRAPPETILPGNRDTAQWLGQELTRLLNENDLDDHWLAERLDEAEAVVAAFGRGEDPYRHQTGIVRRAYRSRLDGKLQPYVAFVPPSHTPDGDPMPLVVGAHGLGSQPGHALRAIIGKASPGGSHLRASRRLPRFRDQGAILVAPLGYGNAGQRPLGEHDVMEVIAQMKAAYRIDPRRVGLTGYSLGGTVAFVVPLHYPDVFSGSAPLCGYPNLKAWRQIRGVEHKPWEDVLIEKNYIQNYAENGKHLPLHVVHGGRDEPERSELMVNRYRRLGFRVWYDLQDDMGHNVWDHAYEHGRMVGWLKRRWRPEVPKEVRLVTADYRYDSAYWVRLVASRDYDLFARIKAVYDEETKRLTVETRNVASMVLDLSVLELAADVVEASVDGTVVQLPASGAALVFEDGWRVAVKEAKQGKVKRSKVAGPLSDALLHRQLLVVGTLDPVQTEANQLVAEHLKSVDPQWHVDYPIKNDVDVTEDDIATHTLVLIGNAASNALTKRMLPHLPVQFEEDALRLGERRFEGADVGVSLVHPHPNNPEEYLVLHAGVGPEGTLASRHLPRFTPDYLVYDQNITVQRRGTLLGERQVLAGGFFDHTWSLASP